MRWQPWKCITASHCNALSLSVRNRSVQWMRDAACTQLKENTMSMNELMSASCVFQCHSNLMSFDYINNDWVSASIDVIRRKTKTNATITDLISNVFLFDFVLFSFLCVRLLCFFQLLWFMAGKECTSERERDTEIERHEIDKHIVCGMHATEFDEHIMRITSSEPLSLSFYLIPIFKTDRKMMKSEKKIFDERNHFHGINWTGGKMRVCCFLSSYSNEMMKTAIHSTAHVVLFSCCFV